FYVTEVPCIFCIKYPRGNLLKRTSLYHDHRSTGKKTTMKKKIAIRLQEIVQGKRELTSGFESRKKRSYLQEVGGKDNEKKAEIRFRRNN
ncbi:unnamed protein product, partial [Heterotrigona itama]